MKTGRRRKKEPAQQPAPPQPEGEQKPTTRAQSSAGIRPRAKKPTPSRAPTAQPARMKQAVLLIVIGLVVFACLAVLLSRACQGSASTRTVYLPATANGSWTTTVRLVVPQVEVRGGWRADCEADPLCTVVPGTCETREREDQATEQKVDEYEDYAYNIYYEETEGKLYEAGADTFVVTQLSGRREWRDGDLHYISEEFVDQDTCQYTNYTIWITDPEDDAYEIEVVLSECEVWDHVIVMQRVGEQDEYCQTEIEGAMGVQDTLTAQGIGAGVEWPDPIPPAGGRLERDFEGRVVFRADGARHEVTVADADKYVRYLTIPYYLGIDEEGDVVDLTDTAP